MARCSKCNRVDVTAPAGRTHRRCPGRADADGEPMPVMPKRKRLTSAQRGRWA